MKKISTLLIVSIFTLFSSFAFADSSDFDGIYIGVSGGVAGSELDGKYTDNDSAVTKGSGGMVTSIASWEIGYDFAIGDMFTIGVGYSVLPGEAKLSKSDSAASDADITVKADNFATAYAQINMLVSESTALMVKAGSVDADLTYAGASSIGTKPGAMSGDVLAFGVKSALSNNLYLKSEVGMIEFEKIKLLNITSNSGANTGDVEADPSVAYGLITLGYQF